MSDTTCPNCGSSFQCYCTWEEKQQAMEILRRKGREQRRKLGKPTVVDQERARKAAESK